LRKMRLLDVLLIQQKIWLKHAKKNCEVHISDYFPSKELVDKIGDKKFKAISSIAMIYDLQDPKDFVSSIKKILAKDGVWVVQFTDLLSTFKLNAFDNICHEHLEYYGLYDLELLFGSFDLEIFAIDRSDANGASIRAFIGHKSVHEVEGSVKEYSKEENEYFKDRQATFKSFREEIKKQKDSLLNFMSEYKNGFVLGASTKGNTLLQYWKLNHNDLNYALEVNPDKFGKKIVVSNIPIIKQDEGLKKKPDFLLVLPWHFIDFFVEKLDSYLEDGGKLVVPLPKFRVYKKKKKSN